MILKPKLLKELLVQESDTTKADLRIGAETKTMILDSFSKNLLLQLKEVRRIRAAYKLILFVCDFKKLFINQSLIQLLLIFPN